MKKYLYLLLTISLIFITGCSSKGEKVNVIKGAGMANNSLMVNFTELTPGHAAGFLGESENLLIRQMNKDGYDIASINIKTKETTVLFSTNDRSDFHLEISPDGSSFICNSYLIDINSRQQTFLPETTGGKIPRPAHVSVLPGYSFSESSELLLTDPYHYIEKYFGKTLKSDSGKEIINVGDKRTVPDLSKYNNINLPDIDYISAPILIPTQLRYIFKGYKKGNDEAILYNLDLMTGKFNVVDNDVHAFAVSPDKQRIAYIKKTSGKNAVSKLYTIYTDGQQKKELTDLPDITGLTWSYDAGWIAYSGGEDSRNDVWLIKSDGSSNEQLTHGMYSTEDLSWSRNGSFLAFTSSLSSSDNARTYIITLSTPLANTQQAVKPLDTQRQSGAYELLELIRSETALIRKGKKF